ncbi:MAG: DUF3159 domain-containing protein [Micromonosporaceae bacterium]|nr:DUF3159 domain-containing protein [Micromonosporaceae bacterium]
MSDAAATDAVPDDATEKLPTFTEQIADQLGGVRGLIESGLPVLVFVVANIVWRLQPAILIAVGSAVLLAVWRLARRQPVRHAVNGVLGVGIGAVIAWKTGSAKNFYLPGILLSLGYALAMLASIVARMPLVGWLWSVVVAKGSTEWRRDPRLVRLFSWLTVLWALTYLAKTLIQALIFRATPANDPGTALGVARILLGYPPYALLLAVTFWAVRRATHAQPAAAGEPAAG